MASKTQRPRDRSGRTPLRKLLTVRRAGALVGGLVLAWYATAATMATVLADRHSGAATMLGLTSADAMAAEALRIMEAQPSPAQVEQAKDLATQALAREPVNSSALRALGLIAVLDRDEAKAEDLFAASERLSRRDLSAQLWLIENAVGHGDIAGALIHYDRALRASDRAAPLLIPILADATAEPLVAAELARLLATRPPWWSTFFERLVATSKSPASLAAITNVLKLDTNDVGERQLLVSAMVRLMQTGAYDQAHALYLRAKGAEAGGKRVRNGEFDETGLLPPFDWSFANESGLAGAVEPRPGEESNVALHLLVDGSGSGEIARQLLMLDPGRYRLFVVAGNVAGPVTSRPAFEVVCASSPPRAIEPVLATMVLPEAPSAGRRATASFTVPADCPAQLLHLRVNNATEAADDAAWVDSIVVEPL